MGDPETRHNSREKKKYRGGQIVSYNQKAVGPFPSGGFRHTIVRLVAVVGHPNKEFRSIRQREWQGSENVQILSDLNGAKDKIPVSITHLAESAMTWSNQEAFNNDVTKMFYESRQELRVILHTQFSG